MIPLFKVCKSCNIKKSYDEGFYKINNKYAQPECKQCMCKTERRKLYKHTRSLIKYPYVKREKKLYGFFKLDIDTQNNIKRCVQEMMTLKTISEIYNIRYGTMKKWSYSGYLKTIPQE